MNKISKLFLLVLVMVLGMVLVGCNNDDPVEPVRIAPTSITPYASIYDSTGDYKYVVVGKKMYIEVESDGPEGYDDSVNWEIDGDAATLAVEDGIAVITGVKGGNVTVTATSAIDPAIKGTYVAEVVESEDFNQIIVDAKNAAEAALPTYVTADFTLPQPANPNVKVTYKSKLKKVWADGVFKYSEAYKASEGDSSYVFYATYEFHGIKKEFEFGVKCVGDAKNNDFYALSAAKAQVEAMFEEKELSLNYKNIVDNGNGTYSLNLPTKIAVEGCTQEITVEWVIESGAGISLKNGNELVYSKPLVDTRCQINALYKAKNNNDISKIFVTAIGWTADEVWAYYKTNVLKTNFYNAATDTFAISTSGVSVSSIDTTKKFKLLTVEYKVCEGSETYVTYNAPTGTNTSGTFRKLSAGEAEVKVTLYYDKQVRKVMVDKLDEDGKLIRDADGKVVQEEVEQVVCAWSQEYTITITLR